MDERSALLRIALYGVQFDEWPAGRAAEVAGSLVRSRSAEDLRALVRETRLELAAPTRQVCDIVDCRAPEAEVREFLRRFADELEAYLARSG